MPDGTIHLFRLLFIGPFAPDQAWPRLVDHDNVLYDHAFPCAPSSRQSGQGEVFWTQLSDGRPFLMNLRQLHPDRDRWVLVLSRPFSDEGKPEPGIFIALFLDEVPVLDTLFRFAYTPAQKMNYQPAFCPGEIIK